jgi:CubicO group peptidase (beta-lactamase class C family)
VLGFGHTGVTGTSLWIDPASRTWVVLLANRTYLPRWDVDMQLLRRRIFRAVTGIPPPK